MRKNNIFISKFVFTTTIFILIFSLNISGAFSVFFRTLDGITANGIINPEQNLYGYGADNGVFGYGYGYGYGYPINGGSSSGGGSSSSSSSGGGSSSSSSGGGGSSSVLTNSTKTIITNETVKKTVLLKIEKNGIKQLIKEKTNYKGVKYTKSVSKIEKHVSELSETINLIGLIYKNDDLVYNYIMSYSDYIQALGDYENKSITKEELNEKIKVFANQYKLFKENHEKIITTQTLSIKGSKYSFNVPKYKNPHDRKTIILLTTKIKKIILSSNFDKNKIEGFAKNYNKMLLSLKLYRENQTDENKKLFIHYKNEAINALK